MGEKHWIFADGACSGNPGPGGWGAILIARDGWVTELGGDEVQSTNNRMELQAVIEALQTLGSSVGGIRIFTDSVYVIKGITVWIFGWQKNGWKTAEGNDVSNREHWVKLSKLIRDRKELGEISWEFVKGHAGIPGNERCDEIAVAFSKGDSVSLYSGSFDLYEVEVKKIPKLTSLPSSKKIEEGYPVYLSLVSGSLEKHKTWIECEARVKGTSGAKFKKVTSKYDEQIILKGWGV